MRDGQTLSAHHTAAAIVAASEGSGELIRTNWDRFDILRADALQAVLQVNGQTIRFTKQADEPFASDNTKINYDVLDEEGRWQGAVGLRYIHPDRQEHIVVALLRDDRTTTQWDGIAVLGNRSRQLDDTRTGTATYDGNAKGHFEVCKSSEGQIWNRYKDSFHSDNGQLIAVFDTNTISGQITYWYTDTDGQQTTLDITATLEPAPITADGFTGQVTMSGDPSHLIKIGEVLRTTGVQSSFCRSRRIGQR